MKDREFKIKANIVLTELPVSIEFYVDKIFWLTSSQAEQASYIWRHIEEEYPLVMEIATINSENYRNVTWIEGSSIKILA